MADRLNNETHQPPITEFRSAVLPSVPITLWLATYGVCCVVIGIAMAIADKWRLAVLVLAGCLLIVLAIMALLCRVWQLYPDRFVVKTILGRKRVFFSEVASAAIRHYDALKGRGTGIIICLHDTTVTNFSVSYLARDNQQMILDRLTEAARKKQETLH